MQIREAKPTDIPRLVEMGSRSLMEGPYKGRIKDNPEQAAVLALGVIQGHNGKFLISEEADKITGFLAFIVFDHYASGEATAGELMWYVEPEHRKSWTAIALLSAAEGLARDMGAVRMQFVAPQKEVARAYEELGYHEIEVTYQKEL